MDGASSFLFPVNFVQIALGNEKPFSKKKLPASVDLDKHACVSQSLGIIPKMPEKYIETRRFILARIMSPLALMHPKKWVGNSENNIN